MSRVRTAGTLFWGLMLVVIGAVFLARNLGYAIPIWDSIARYWPAILIVWGGFKLLDYFLRGNGTGRPLFSAGEIVVLIMVILAGSAITIAANISPDLANVFDFGDVDIWDITGNSFQYTEHHEMEARAGSTIEIINRFGGVEVVASDVDRITVDVKKTVLASNQSEADRLAPTLTFSIKDEAPGYRISADFGGDNPPNRGRRIRTALAVRVPKNSSLRLNNRNGQVNVSGLVGDQDITNSFAEVIVKNIEGKVDIHNRNGSVEVGDIRGSAAINNSFSSVDVRGVSGTLQIENRNGNVEVADIAESVKIENSFAGTTVRELGGDLEINTRNGSVEADSVKGGATISSTFAPIRLSDIQGPVRITDRNGSVEVERAQNDVSVETSFDSVTVRDAKGAVTVSNRNGDVLVRTSQAPTKDISVSTQFSGVTVELPAGSAFNVDARTRFGQIDASFDGLNASSNERERTLNGQVGQGGPSIRLETRNGNIRLGRF